MNWKKDKSPVDSNPTVDGDHGDGLMEESTFNVDSYTVQEPLPLPVNEVVPQDRKSTRLNSSHRL